MNKKLLAGLLCSLLVITMAGCGVKLTDTSLYIHRDGSIEAAVYEAFDEKAYQLEELKAFMEEAVSSYNQNTAGITAAYKKDHKEGLPVTIDSINLESEDAVLKMTYASSDDYLAFNEGDDSILNLLTAQVGEQEAYGCNLSEFSLVNAEGESYEEELKEDASFVIVEGDKKILVEGKILCVSKGVVVTEKNTAEVTPEAGRCLIVFSK